MFVLPALAKAADEVAERFSRPPWSSSLVCHQEIEKRVNEGVIFLTRFTWFAGSSGSVQPPREEEGHGEEAGEEDELHLGDGEESNQPEKVIQRCLTSSPALSPAVICPVFNLQPLSLCRSSPVISEPTTAEKEKTDEEEAQKDVAAPVEELVAAMPPAAREVPAHLQKQAVRTTIHPQRSF